jgi:hypothetical protein
MNGPYDVVNDEHSKTPFNSDYASKGHSYFDVYTPELAHHYGQVFWTDMGENPLPDEIVNKFKGKVIAITGYEADQVMVRDKNGNMLKPDDSTVETPACTRNPSACKHDPTKDVSVPFNWVYNHHYMAWMTGERSEMRHVLVEKRLMHSKK